MALKEDFDLLTATASDLQRMIQAGTVTSVDLVEKYYAQIERHNTQGMMLHAVISVAPKQQSLEAARELDAERTGTGPRGPLHGIPVILKDNFNSPRLGMDTTCGSLALKGQTAVTDAAVVKRMVQAGLLVLAKANMSEWAWGKGARDTGGWSAAGGQTQSPYVRGGVAPGAAFLGHSTPSASSSGSAVAVAAGFAPIAYGVETIGSVVQPAGRAALYALKVTPGTVDTSGLCPGNPDFDGIGAMAKSVADVADAISVLMSTDPVGFSGENLARSWEGLRIGFVDPELWQQPEHETEVNEEYRKESNRVVYASATKIASLSKTVVQYVQMPQDPPGFGKIIGSKFRESLETYLSLFENPPIRNLDDLIQFNKDHAAEELPLDHSSQDQLETFARSIIPSDEYERTFKEVRAEARSSIDSALSAHQIDVILGPADSRLVAVASAAGYPSAAVPLGFAAFNGRAYGLALVARAGEERKLLQVMSAWEATFPEARMPPPMMLV